MIKKRNSPGIEINEIDRSQYNKVQDYSIVNTNVLVCGFADKGENYTTKWINTKQTFEDEYGYPTNEVEKYFYNASMEVLNKGGVLLTSKLPYNNFSKDKFAKTIYKINTTNIQNSHDDIYLNKIKNELDNSISSYITIELDSTNNNDLISINDFDDLKTNTKQINNEIQIIDITQKQYKKIDVVSCYELDDKSKIYNTNNIEFLGIMPVIVSPINAMYFQQLLSDESNILLSDGENSGEQTSLSINYFNVVSNASNRKNDELSDYLNINVLNRNFSCVLSSNYINDETVSKIAAKTFPIITLTQTGQLNKKYLKHIGIAVFEVFKDLVDNGKINFRLVESFSGSLDRNERDTITKQTLFIDNIINTQSKYINVFSNIDAIKLKNTDTFLIQNQKAKILGYTSEECEKNIDYTESIIKPISRIFEKIKDPNYIDIDIICDAGVSNIAQYAGQFGNNGINIENYPFILSDNNSKWVLNNDSITYKYWKNVLFKFDEFCKKQRQDCIFIADGLRTFCLVGNEKIVRRTNLTNTIENSIIPKLKYMTGINSSYSAGYCNWFYLKDIYTNDYFWCPPSIKAMGAYIYTDVYFNPWDAPAGLNRGVIKDAIDTAFSPKNDEAGKIYLYSWNYAVNYPLDGIVIEGQKTFQIEKTALDRVNVRRLLLSLKKNVSTIARRFLYEGNTEYTRQRFIDSIRPFFEDAKNRYGLNDYVILCDKTLNTPEVIDRNEMHCKIAIKPIKTIEWIICDFIVTNQSANIKEEIINT